MKMYRKSAHLVLLGLACFSCLLFAGCDDGATTAEDYVGVQVTEPHDPSKPVTITSFTPSTGGVGQQLVIHGSNFGCDKSLLHLTIGGKDAVIASVKNDVFYCYVPSGAFTGEIVLTVGDSLHSQTVQAKDKFEYQRKMVVGNLCRHLNERGEAPWVDGTFEEATGFKNDGVMQFSPYNHDQLFVLYDTEPRWGTPQHGIQLLDLKERTVKTIINISMFNSERTRTIDFAVDPYAYTSYGEMQQTGTDEEGNPTYFATDEWLASAASDQLRWREHLIISVDQYSSDFRAPAAWIVDRNRVGDFSNDSPHRILASYNQCNGAYLHPNGELYFTSYTQGEILRLDMDQYWATLPVDGGASWEPNALDNPAAFERLIKVQDNSYECQIDIHPTGKYAYIVVINRHYMLRTDYNEKTKRFSTPYVIAGQLGQRGFDDGVGQSAKMSRPYQGTFVKNDKYAGSQDEYDFYFCDSENDAIRYLTPDGIVSTYAGGSAATHADGLTHGSENGELRDVARFYRCTGLVNDVHKDKITGENTLIFYILDTNNAKIRTITMEEQEEEEEQNVNVED